MNEDERIEPTGDFDELVAFLDGQAFWQIEAARPVTQFRYRSGDDPGNLSGTIIWDQH